MAPPGRIAKIIVGDDGAVPSPSEYRPGADRGGNEGGQGRDEK